MSKIDLSIEILDHSDMIAKFPTIVTSDRLYMGVVRAEPRSDRRPNRGGGFVLNHLEHHILGLAFH